MEIVRNCRDKIRNNIAELGRFIPDQHVDNEDLGGENLFGAQGMIAAAMVARDKNLDKILDQQASIKTIIETDNVIRGLRRSIDHDTKAIDSLRKAVSHIGVEAMKNRTDLLETQSKDVERFQLHQLKSIAEDYKRHQEILEFRKKEIVDMKKEIENEENGLGPYLADFEKKLEQTLQNRQRNQGDSLFPMTGMNDEFDEPDVLELTSINEYAPYGTAPGTKSPTKRKSVQRGRGRRRGGVKIASR